MELRAAACVRCGAELAPGADACGKCGTLVARSALPGAMPMPVSGSSAVGGELNGRYMLSPTADTQKKMSGDVTDDASQFQSPPPTSGSSADDARFREGQRMLGHYIVVKQLGRGGMGTVYLARDDVSGQEVAVKVLPAALARERDIRERFIQEARALATMDHPNIVPLITFAQEGEDRFLVMKYLAGESLDARLRRVGVLSPEHARKVLRAVLAALGYAHARGVIHRDVKPSNVLIEGDLDGEHRVVLVDFGIAKKEAGGERLTQTGMLMGTPQYMSPEQIGGQPVDGRSDLYAAGLVLFEMLTGRPPFDGQKTFQVLRAHVEQAVPDIHEARGAPVPEDLAAIAYTLLRKEPDERPRDAVEAIALLDGTGSFPLLKNGEERLTPSTVSVRAPSGLSQPPTAAPPAVPSNPPLPAAAGAEQSARHTPSGFVDKPFPDLNDPSAEELAFVRRRGSGFMFATVLFLGAALVAGAAVFKPWTYLNLEGGVDAGGGGSSGIVVDNGNNNGSATSGVDRAAVLLLVQAARTSLKAGDAPKAFNAIEAAVEQDPSDVDAKSLQVDVRIASGMFDDADTALAELKTLLEKRPDPEAAARIPDQEALLAQRRVDKDQADKDAQTAKDAADAKAQAFKDANAKKNAGGGDGKKLIPDSAIRKAAASTRSAVSACYSEHVQSKDKKAVGEITVSVRFDNDGTVDSARVMSSKGAKFKSPSFQQCVAGEIKKWRVPAFKGDAPPVPYTIEFHPS